VQTPFGSRRRSAAANSNSEKERQLLACVALRDDAAFAELYALYHRRLARFLRRFTSRYDVIEEIINDTMWVVWRKCGEFRGDSMVSTWIMGIAYRRAMKSLQQFAATAPTGVRSGSLGELAGESAQASTELRDWLQVAMTQLPMEQRMVLELTYYVGHSCEEVAGIMDCPTNTVKTRMFHGRAKLRALLPQLAGYAPGVHRDD
jgi:RNA polymerase sigma-70 factor, ECF subfamily